MLSISLATSLKNLMGLKKNQKHALKVPLLPLQHLLPPVLLHLNLRADRPCVTQKNIVAVDQMIVNHLNVVAENAVQFAINKILELIATLAALLAPAVLELVLALVLVLVPLAAIKNSFRHRVI